MDWSNKLPTRRRKPSAAEIAAQLQEDTDSDENGDDSGSDVENVSNLRSPNLQSECTSESDEESSSDDDTTEVVPPLKRRLINAGDQLSLDDISSVTETEKSDEQFSGQDGTIWSSAVPKTRSIGRTCRSKDRILRKEGGPTKFILMRSKDAKDIFLELLTYSNLSDIVKYTNKEAERGGEHNFNLTETELIAFIGLCLARGVFKGKNEPVKSFWSSDYGKPLFIRTMSRKRFLLLQRFLRFDDKVTRPSRRKSDKFSAIRQVWSRCVDRFQTCYFPPAMSQWMNSYCHVSAEHPSFSTCHKSQENSA